MIYLVEEVIESMEKLGLVGYERWSGEGVEMMKVHLEPLQEEMNA